jgi:hypothetical protein
MNSIADQPGPKDHANAYESSGTSPPDPDEVRGLVDAMPRADAIDVLCARGHSRHDAEAAVNATLDAKLRDAPTDGRQPPEAEALVALGREADLFRSPTRDAFATFAVAGHKETWPVRSTAFREWLTLGFMNARGKPPSTTAVAAALAALEAIARQGAEHHVATRVAAHEGALYVDLADDDWRAVEITGDGWRVTVDPPVRFRRSPGMRPLPKPERGGSLDALRTFVNTPDDWRLMAAWLVGTLMPDGPYPVLVLNGERGTAKSSATRRLREVIDPSAAPTRDQPRDNRDLAIAARGARVLAFDNLSYLSPSVADALCRLATGGGFAIRKLYTDDEEALFYDKRPIVMNGIEELATRGDLLDRAIVVRLPVIEPSDRRPEADLDREFAAAHPAVLGALFDAGSAALRNLPRTQIANPSRMADFERWVAAAAPALGWPAGEFEAAYARNRADAVGSELEASPVAAAVIELVGELGEWRGQPADLLRALGERVDLDARGQGWPRHPRGLSGALKRTAPALRAVGVDVEQGLRLGRNARGIALRAAERPAGLDL